jgi:hypothetical protein
VGTGNKSEEKEKFYGLDLIIKHLIEDICPEKLEN